MSGTTFRIRARRAGSAGVLNLSIPAAVSDLFPPGGHDFELSLIEDGILLRYIGPATGDGRRRGIDIDRPSWLPGGGTDG